MRQDRPGLALSRWFRQARAVLLARRVVTEEPDGGFGAGPRAVGMADLLAGGAVACAGGGVGARDEAARGDQVRHPWDTADGLDLLQPHAREDVADAWDRAQPVAGLGLRCLCRPHASQLEVSQPAVVSVDPGAVHVEALRDSRLGQSGRHARPVRLVGERCADLGEVVRTVGLWARSQPLGPLAPELPPPPKSVARGAPLGGIHRGLGPPPATPEDGDLLGLNRLVCGLAPRDGLQVQGLAPDAGHPLVGAEVGPPGPR
jgi:hypothetical protein